MNSPQTEVLNGVENVSKFASEHASEYYKQLSSDQRLISGLGSAMVGMTVLMYGVSGLLSVSSVIGGASSVTTAIIGLVLMKAGHALIESGV